jgi:succinylarginine dihydrolase
MFEHAQRQQQFQQMLASASAWPAEVHDALPPLVPLRDEGAANHMRLCDASGAIGFHVFVYGEAEGSPRPARHLARQTLAACQAVARLHGLDPARTFFLQQHPDAIDAGVFHNDVIATSHRDVLLMHEQAFLESDAEIDRLAQAFSLATGTELKVIRLSRQELSLQDAVDSYLFNSQLLTPPNLEGNMVMVCAAQCERMAHVRAMIERLIAAPNNPISAVHYVALDQSMSGGGGPACLRLRVPLPADMVEQFAPRFRLSGQLYGRLMQLIEEHYPEQLTWDTLAVRENLDRYARVAAAMDRIFCPHG